MRIFQILLSLPVMITFLSCDQHYQVVYENSVSANSMQIHDDTLICESDRCFSRASKPNSQGIRITYRIPEGLKKGEFIVVYEGNLRTNNVFSQGFMNIILEGDGGELIHWGGQPLRYFVYETNTWCHFKDSMKVKYESWQKPYNVLHLFSFLGNDSIEKWDMDSIKIKIKVED